MKRIACLLMLFILAGCSGKPSNRQIENEVVKNVLSDGGNELFQVENFVKTNGFEKSEHTYIADVKYDLVFKKSLEEVAQQLKNESQGSPFGALGSGLGILALNMQFGNFEAGQRVNKEEKVTFIKTENGWRIEE